MFQPEKLFWPMWELENLRFGQAEAVIQGLETLQCPAVLVGQALANFQATEWTKENVLQVNSVTWLTFLGLFWGGS